VDVSIFRLEEGCEQQQILDDDPRYPKVDYSERNIPPIRAFKKGIVK
jgi:hypothetical protein